MKVVLELAFDLSPQTSHTVFVRNVLIANQYSVISVTVVLCVDIRSNILVQLLLNVFGKFSIVPFCRIPLVWKNGLSISCLALPILFGILKLACAVFSLWLIGLFSKSKISSMNIFRFLVSLWRFRTCKVFSDLRYFLSGEFPTHASLDFAGFIVNLDVRALVLSSVRLYCDPLVSVLCNHCFYLKNSGSTALYEQAHKINSPGITFLPTALSYSPLSGPYNLKRFPFIATCVGRDVLRPGT